MAQSELEGFEEATVNMAGGNIRRANLRNNDRVISDDHTLAAEMWALAAPYASTPFKGRRAVGHNERMRFYRYDVGQKFDWHQDGYFERATASAVSSRS